MADDPAQWTTLFNQHEAQCILNAAAASLCLGLAECARAQVFGRSIDVPRHEGLNSRQEERVASVAHVLGIDPEVWDDVGQLLRVHGERVIEERERQCEAYNFEDPSTAS